MSWRVVNDLDISTELPVVVLEGAEAVRAVGDDLLDAVLFKELRCFRGPACQTRTRCPAGAGSRRSTSPRSPGLPSERLAALRMVVRAVTTWRLRESNAPAHPTKKRYSASRSVGKGLDVEILGPLGPVGGRDAPGIGALLGVFEEGDQLFGELRLFHHQVAPHADKLGDVLDENGALHHAGAAGGAGPDGIGGNAFLAAVNEGYFHGGIGRG